MTNSIEGFIALDVETANADLASICQLGLAEFRDGQLARSEEWLVDPEDYFDGMNVSIHGIDEDTVRGKPTWSRLHENISQRLRGRIVVCHTLFDRTSLYRAGSKYRLTPIEAAWLDSARVVRRTWSEYTRAGYGLANVAKNLGISFKHHNALEDARASGEILIRAIQHSGISLNNWLVQSHRPIGEDTASGTKRLTRTKLSIARDGNAEGPLFGETLAFTGALSISRSEVAQLASRAGCAVASGVNRKTTLLVVGDQDIKKLAGQTRSLKHRKAEELITAGQPIRILGESDFWALLSFDKTT